MGVDFYYMYLPNKKPKNKKAKFYKILRIGTYLWPNPPLYKLGAG